MGQAMTEERLAEIERHAESESVAPSEVRELLAEVRRLREERMEAIHRIAMAYHVTRVALRPYLLDWVKRQDRQLPGLTDEESEAIERMASREGLPPDREEELRNERDEARSLLMLAEGHLVGPHAASFVEDLRRKLIKWAQEEQDQRRRL
jgi:hypothetical protein